ncbi:MAG: phosphotransferase [Rhizobiales bacterium]|nr:phosphotransferase [Hyphomicrobiales bacterium]MBO6697610.1 phosphotransferase [Hyphomicrobiales bacterium]MBO6736135.1 phosphotransferase [Hyphomicrobiales bacterium]MBO6912605.1 phosphotransferase [Hyphomicrobiales bacterium]MBO6956822.1 phosphotransferase [Hyphomicrobiales bacterium]
MLTETPPNDPFLRYLRTLLPSYGRSASAELTRLTVSENHTYRVDDGDARLVLRVHRAGYHTREEILSELDWVSDLHSDATLHTAKPLARSDGERLSSVEHDGTRHWVSAFSFLEGEEPVVGSHLVERFEELGAINARLHAHVKSWQRPEQFARKRWDFDLMFGASPIWGDWRAAFSDKADIDLLETLENSLRERLATFGEGPERFGLIHGDLRVANLLDDGKRLAVIDFDDCGFGWFAYDFAAAISFHEEDEAIPALQAAWLRGYRGIAPFDAEDEAILPTMIMARRLLLTAWLASRTGNDTDAVYGRGFADGTVRLARAHLG